MGEKAGTGDGTRDAAEFLRDYDDRFRALYTASSLAEWEVNTRIVEGDDSRGRRVREANEALAAFTGSVAVIEEARAHLARPSPREPLAARRLERILFQAASGPQTAPDLVRRRIAGEAAQTERMYGFRFSIDGRPVTPNDIDGVLRKETDLERRRAAWEASKEVGPALKDGLVELRGLRNGVVRALGHADWFSYMTSEYGTDAGGMMDLLATMGRELRPLYRELHTWARHELARRFGKPVPDLLPAHWLPNRWGQEWTPLAGAGGADPGPALRSRGAEWVVRRAEEFYRGLGFEPLPECFWRESSLFPAPPDAGWKKNTHASAWHVDLEREVRCLMSVEPDAEWFETCHHELGHIQYFLAYSRPGVPAVLRTGADRAWHEAVGSLLGMAAMQPRALASAGLAPAGPRGDPIPTLLREALRAVVLYPWSAGTMAEFERDLYAGELDPGRWNARWWELAARHQGIAPPSERDERWCDAATKTHVNDSPGRYYDYALSFVLLHQLHDHVARKVLRQDPRDTDYTGRKEVGEFLRSVLEPGATVDGRTLVRRATGEDLSARAMVEYFAPLEDWLRRENRGRKATLPEV